MYIVFVLGFGVCVYYKNNDAYKPTLRLSVNQHQNFRWSPWERENGHHVPVGVIFAYLFHFHIAL